MKISKEKAYLAAIGSDLKVFLQQAFRTIYPNNQFMDNWHIDAIIYCLKRCIEGTMPRLTINLPPRQLKSFLASVVLPAFILGRDPTAKIICISYSDELARTLSRDFRRIVESTWYRKVFPQVRLSKTTENEIATKEGGFRYATSVGGTLTGRGGDFIIIDDPIKPEDAQSEKLRTATNEWFKSTVLSRLDDKKRSVLLLVMQRLHVNDLTGFVEAGGGFHKISFSAIATRDEHIPVSETEEHVRVEGEALHEAREGLDVLQKIRDEIGPHNFAAQYQQRPDTPDGTFFKRKYIRLIPSTHGIKPDGLYWISIDSAMSTSETADFSAITVGYSNGDGHYVLFAERGRWDYEALVKKTFDYAKRYDEATFVVEAANTGISLLQYLEKREILRFGYRPKIDKMERAALVLPIFHDRRVFILNQQGKNAWVQPYIDELVTFPFGRFDDQVDSLVQALNWAEPKVRLHGSICFY